MSRATFRAEEELLLFASWRLTGEARRTEPVLAVASSPPIPTRIRSERFRDGPRDEGGLVGELRDEAASFLGLGCMGRVRAQYADRQVAVL